jgi:tRNA(His) 5'-end guanylyltransferase
VRRFEQADCLLPNTWIVVRVDGRGFHSYVMWSSRLLFLPNLLDFSFFLAFSRCFGLLVVACSLLCLLPLHSLALLV